MTVAVTLLVVTVLGVLAGLVQVLRGAVQRNLTTAVHGLGLLFAAALLSSVNVLAAAP